MILLDSDVIIEILNKQSKRGDTALDKLENMEDTEILISTLVYEEVLFGILKQQDLKTLPVIHPLNQLPVLDFTKADAEIAANIEITMEKQGKKKPRGDVLIAATAINHNASFFTFNKKHYADIEKLKLIE